MIPTVRELRWGRRSNESYVLHIRGGQGWHLTGVWVVYLRAAALPWHVVEWDDEGYERGVEKFAELRDAKRFAEAHYLLGETE